MKTSKPQIIRILAINLSAKYLGLAVLKNTELLYWVVKKLREKGMTDGEVLKRTRKNLLRLVNDYSVKVIVIGKPSIRQLQDSPRLRLVYRKLKELGRKKSKKVLSFPLLEAREFICQGEKPTKMNVERMIVSQYYPWLYRRYQKDLEKDLKGHWWERKYYTVMFDAIALSLYCYQKLKTKTLS